MRMIAFIVATMAATCLSTTASDGCCAKKEENKKAPAGACSHAPGSAGCGDHGGGAQAKGTTIAAKRALPPELQPVFARYLEMQSELAKDSTKGLSTAGKAMATAMRKSGSGCLSSSAATAEEVGTAKDIKAAREAFGKLSELMYQFVSIANVQGYNAFYCQMAKAGWLQSDTKMRNPYMGAAMLECGQKVGG